MNTSCARPVGTISLRHGIQAFSTTATADASGSSSSASKTDNGSQQQAKAGDKDKSKDKKDSSSNIFLDNLGKIFLSAIGLVLLMLLRSTKSNNSRSALREDIESTALLDPLEIDDLRVANSDFTIEVWERIVDEIKREFASRGGTVTYPEFLSVVMKVMKEMKGEGFTIQFGHLVDRVVIAELEKRRGEREGGDGGSESAGEGEQSSLLQNELPLAFLLAALSLALNSTIAERVRVLYESMLLSDGEAGMASSVDEAPDVVVAGESVSQMIQHLQSTCQLVPEAQIVETNSKVPYQTYRVGTGDELTRRAREGYGGKKGSAGVTREKEGPVTLDEFYAVLKSRTVCAWGECYVKKTNVRATSDR